jgi:hypothetical protein
MSQTVVLDQLQQYIDLLIVEQTSKAEIAHLKKLKASLNEGHCFGFSISHATMNYLGKLSWWESALNELTKWDGEAATLEQPTALPQQDTSDNPRSQPTLRNLLERVLNYVVWSQTDLVSDEFDLNGRNFRTFLDPRAHISKDKDGQIIKKSFFELTDAQGDIKTIKKHKVIGGYFKDQLANILNQDCFTTDKIAIISSHDHALHISYDEKAQLWMLYDPNYKHNKLGLVHRTFSDKELLVNEIHKCLGTHAIKIEVASFNENDNLDFAVFDELLEKQPLSLLKGRGMQVIAKIPAIAVSICERAVSDSSLRLGLKERLQDYMNLLISYSPPALFQLLKFPASEDVDSQFLSEIKSAVKKFFVLMSENSSETISKLFDMAHDDLEMRQLVIDAMKKKTTKGGANLSLFVEQYSPELLNKLCILAEGDQAILQVMARGLTEQDSEKRIKLHVIAQSCPEAFLKICELANQQDEIEEVVRAALQNDDARKNSIIHAVAQFNPTILPKMLALFEKNNWIQVDFLQALARKNSEGETGLQKMVMCSPEMISKNICTLALNHDENKPSMLTRELFLAFQKNNMPLFQKLLDNFSHINDGVRVENELIANLIHQISDLKNKQNQISVANLLTSCCVLNPGLVNADFEKMIQHPQLTEFMVDHFVSRDKMHRLTQESVALLVDCATNKNEFDRYMINDIPPMLDMLHELGATSLLTEENRDIMRDHISDIDEWSKKLRIYLEDESLVNKPTVVTSAILKCIIANANKNEAEFKQAVRQAMVSLTKESPVQKYLNKLRPANDRFFAVSDKVEIASQGFVQKGNKK